MKRFKVALPPSLEQAALVAHVRNDTQTLETAISRTEREITLLREYRTTLTAEVVTGKLDVHEAAQRLPAEAVEPLPGDDLPEYESSDDVPEEADA